MDAFSGIIHGFFHNISQDTKSPSGIPRRIYVDSPNYYLSPAYKKQRRADHPFSLLFSGKASMAGSPLLMGSMTVEASLAVPVFILAVLSLYMYFSVLWTHCSLVMDQREKGKEICIYANVYQPFLGVGDTVFLTENRQVSPISPTLFTKDFLVSATYYAHAWTGYKIGVGADSVLEEEYVYITPRGEAYHKDINCSYLKLKINRTTKEALDGIRNADGGKYNKCQYCGRRTYNGVLYVTDYGEHYHTSLGCPGLKRTIETVPISKVGGRRPCVKCGG